MSARLAKWIMTAMLLGVVGTFGYDAYQEYQDTKRLHEEVSAQAANLTKNSVAEPQIEIKHSQQVIVSKNAICREGENCPRPEPDRVIERIIERQVCDQKDTSLEFDAIIVKLKMQNESSWMAIVKLLVAMLVAVFGIKLINYLFTRIA
jgi:hypothetical protein